jgi:type II secretory pathway component PulF
MHDPDFDGDYPKKVWVEPIEPPLPTVSLSERLAGLRELWPIPRIAQAIFAEAFRQAIEERLTIDHAIRLAAEVNPSRRFRVSLRQMAIQVRSGYPLDQALEKTRARVSAGLPAALRVGEEHGCLANELGAFARKTSGFTRKRYFRAIGRGDEAIDFAAALGRLLQDQRLTVRAVRAAGDVSASDRPQFLKVIHDVAQKMEDGSPFVTALGKYPRYFDELYRGFLEAAGSREEMKTCLERLGTRP